MSSELETGKRKRITELVCICVFALLGSIGVTGITSGSSVLTYTNSFFAVLFFGINLFLFSKIWSEFVVSPLREKLISAVPAVVISTALHLGAQFESTDSAELAAKSMVVCTLAFAIYLTPVINACFDTIRKLASKKKR